MRSRRGLAWAVEVGRFLLGADAEFVACSDLFIASFAAFAAQAGTRLSLADMAIARFALQHADGQVLSFDAEFRQVPGLQVLPPARA